jgi:hypothetical protein
MWGILNHVGDVWTSDTFDTKEEAQRDIDDYAQNMVGGLPDHKPVRVLVTVSVQKADRE